MVQGRDRDERVSFPANTWYDAYQLLPSSSLFNSWEKRERKEGPQTISLTDIPSIPISWGRRRTLKFRITVESAPWCDCKNAKHTAYATRTLSAVDLEGMGAEEREMLFRRTGRILRRIDQLELAHFDAKASNWIVQEDEKLGARPILVDVDGIRFRRWAALGISRLLRAMREHPQYTVADSLALCQGYAPFAPTPAREKKLGEKA